MKKIKLTVAAAKKIKQALKRHKMTQEDFAEAHLNVTLRTFQNYLMSKTAIPLDKLDIIQKTFGMVQAKVTLLNLIKVFLLYSND